MELFEKLGINKQLSPTIDWDLIPAETFAIFESWGGKDQQRLRSGSERYYYFFVDGWGSPPSLCLMERGIKHARIIATIDAPQDLIDQAIKDEGLSKSFDRNYAINEGLKTWLLDNVVDSTDLSMVHPIVAEEPPALEAAELPAPNTPLPENITPVQLTSTTKTAQEDEILGILSKYNFYDSSRNQNGSFASFLVDSGDNQTISDKATGLMWQQGGADLTSIRKMRAHVDHLNAEDYAGFSDWRLPTMEEAFSLMTPDVQNNDLHMDPCFKDDTPFIFVAEKRNPGGYWFCDYKQGTVFWASGTIPGGYGKVCRTI
ncbi:MAG: DUF1566 domain-containing protein [Desulfobulbaceae bacterium]|jgi:hypothetical protein|nr:DUF1566 domain-containing protein [Desulfobulbaceae bacterium]